LGVIGDDALELFYPNELRREVQASLFERLDLHHTLSPS